MVGIKTSIRACQVVTSRVPHIVTSSLGCGRCTGTFVLDRGGSLVHCSSRLSHNELSPSLSHNELSPSLSHNELSPSLSHNELTPSLSHNELSPSLSHNELTPSLSHNELSPSLSKHWLYEVR